MTFDRMTRRACIAAAPAALAAIETGSMAFAHDPGRAPPPRASNHRLWYRQPASRWVEALPVGNGRLGAMVFGGTDGERLQLNEDTLWSGGPYDPAPRDARPALDEVRRLIAQGRYAEAEALTNARLMGHPLHQMSYQTFGDLYLDMALDGAVDGYRRDLDLDSAVASTRFRHGATRCLRQTFASPVDQVIVTRIVADRPLNLTLRFDTPHRATIVARDSDMRVTGHNAAEEGVARALAMAAHIRALAEGGTVHAADGRIAIAGARAVTVLVALGTSYRGPADTSGDPVAGTAQAIERAAALPFPVLKARAVGAHRRLYRAATLDLGDSAGAALPTDARIVANQTDDDPAWRRSMCTMHAIC